MIKASRRGGRGILDIDDEGIALVASHLTNTGSIEHIKIKEAKQGLTDGINSSQRRIDELESEINANEAEITELDKKIAALPLPPIVSPETAKKDLERATSLAFVKGIRVENMDGRKYVVITTRANALYTTLDKKFSANQRWYSVRPYRIALPSYRIRLALAEGSVYTQNDRVLGITLADWNDTRSFLPSITIYSHQPHAHWAAMQAGSGIYNGLCLGEYEDEIKKEFQESVADGLIALAVFLQTSEASSAYIRKRERWALWLGKTEYNLTIVPSEKEIKTLVEDTEDDTGNDVERPCGCMESEDGARSCDSACACYCHNFV